jgi:hypothetical protein
MMMRKELAAAALAVFVVGCGESGPSLVPVSGVVTLNGKPLEGAVVSFLPDSSNQQGQPGEDLTGPSGNYKAMTRGRSGLVPGKYRVVVSKSLVDPSKIPDAFKDDPFMAQLSADGPAGKAAKKKDSSKDKIEGKFSRDVPPEGGQLDFDVKAKAEGNG